MLILLCWGEHSASFDIKKLTFLKYLPEVHFTSPNEDISNYKFITIHMFFVPTTSLCSRAHQSLEPCHTLVAYSYIAIQIQNIAHNLLE